MKKKRKDFGIKGRQKILNEFTEEEMIERYIKIINLC